MTIILETARVSLRTWTPDDAADGYAIWSDPEVMRYIGDGQPYRDVEQTRGWMQRMIAHQQQHGFCYWAVVDKESAQLIGSCGLCYQLDGGLPVGFGYTLARAFWGRGLATEMSDAALRYVFAHTPLTDIHASVDSRNVASRRVLEKIGFVYDRTEQLKDGIDLWHKATPRAV